MTTAPHVYTAINDVTAIMSKEGIAKSRKNSAQGYAFRGIDDVYKTLSGALVEAKLCIIPKMLEREIIERTTKNGTALFYITLKAQFDFVSMVDGSKHEVVTYGEAMDSGDKATNKAMSAAYKYAALMTFCIPTEGDHDTENQTHEVVSAIKNIGGSMRVGAEEQAEKSFWNQTKLIEPLGSPPNVDGKYSDDVLRVWFSVIKKKLEKAPTREHLARYQSDNQHIIDMLPSTGSEALREAFEVRSTQFDQA